MGGVCVGGFQLSHGPKAEPARAPITKRSARAHEELIEAEVLAAERANFDHLVDIYGDPGWREGVLATLNEVWRGSGVPPLEARSANAG